MLRDIPLEAFHDTGIIVEEGSNIRRGDIGSRARKVVSSPFDELIFSSMVVIVLHQVCQRFNQAGMLLGEHTLSTSGIRS